MFNKIWNWLTYRSRMEEQLFQLRVMLNSDLQWLGKNKVAYTLCLRYLQMLDSNWKRYPIVPIEKLRQELDLDPWKK